jgi:hypothetical protein
MNERIELLAKQAGYKHPDAVGTCEDFAYFDLQKFADLILFECVKLAVFNGDSNTAKTIKQHFGVK